MARYHIAGQATYYPGVPRLGAAKVLDFVFRIAPGGTAVSYGGFFGVENILGIVYEDFSFSRVQFSLGTYPARFGYFLGNVFAAITANSWQHLRIRLDQRHADPAQIKIWLNGVVQTGSTSPCADVQFTSFATVGVRLGYEGHDALSRIGIYDRELTDEEMGHLVRGAYPHEVAPEALGWSDPLDPGQSPHDIVSGHLPLVISGSDVPDVIRGPMRRTSLYGPTAAPWLQSYLKVR